MRTITGWLPFSLGDIIYLLVVLKTFHFIYKSIKTLVQKKASWQGSGWRLEKLVRTLAIVYILFSFFWGLNYYRQGIAHQLQIKPAGIPYQDLKLLTDSLINEINASHPVKNGEKDSMLSFDTIRKLAVESYNDIKNQHDFLAYKMPSIKKSSFSIVGNYLGFSGYYNPLSAEAQLNKHTPYFLIPFVTCHEMAHQLGYAKEDEANFVGYLVATNSPSKHFKYSANLEMFLYANRYIQRYDTAQAKANFRQLDSLVRQDLKFMYRFYAQYENKIEPVVKWMYGKYLQSNNQPKSMLTYNESIALLMAWRKKK